MENWSISNIEDVWILSEKIQNSVAPLMMEIDKIFTEILQVGQPNRLFSFTIGG